MSNGTFGVLRSSGGFPGSPSATPKKAIIFLCFQNERQKLKYLPKGVLSGGKASYFRSSWRCPEQPFRQVYFP